MGGSGPNTIGVRTRNDAVESEHDHKLMERILHENENPFQKFVDPFLTQASHVYNTYLYSSGVLFCMLAFWSVYPSFVRYRHQHWFRYRRTQLTFRRGFFATPHMPKWDKKYLQRLVIPPLPQPRAYVATDAAAPAMVSEAAAEQLNDGAAAARAVAVVPPAGKQLAVQSSKAAVNPLFQVSELRTTASAPGSFASADAEKSERAIKAELQRINKELFGPKSDLFNRPIDARVESVDLHTRVTDAVKAARAVVVLKEDHQTLQSIPDGWEVWWVSEPEAKRRRFCKFWLGGLVLARAFQDLMEMPDMPDLIN